MHTIVSLPISYWNILVTFVLPALVALVTKRFADRGLKAIILLVLSVIGGFINQVIAQGGHFEIGQSLWYIVGTFLGAALVHFGLLSPAQITGAWGLIAKHFPGGLGQPGTDKTPAPTVTTTSSLGPTGTV